MIDSINLKARQKVSWKYKLQLTKLEIKIYTLLFFSLLLELPLIMLFLSIIAFDKSNSPITGGITDIYFSILSINSFDRLNCLNKFRSS